MANSRSQQMATSESPLFKMKVAEILARDHSDILRAVQKEVSAILNVDMSVVRPDLPLLDLGAESFDFVGLVFRLERVYGTKISRKYAVPDGYTTVDTFVRAVVEGLVTAEINKSI